MNETGRLQVEIHDQVMRLTLQREEKKNALTQRLYGDLAAALQRADADPQVRVVLMSAAGADFSAGNDLGDFAAVIRGALRFEDLVSVHFLECLMRLAKPCVAAVQGRAIGVGATMLLHCDLVYVAEDAQLSTPFVNLGVVPEAASSVLLPARIGHARAFAMFALGEPIDGRTAVQWGLATAVVASGELQDTARRAALALAARPPGALRRAKRLIRDPEASVAAMRREMQVFGECLRSPEAAEALAAFAERRRADFSRFD